MARIRTTFLKPIALVLVIVIGWSVALRTVGWFARGTFFEFQAPAWTALSYLKDLPRYWNLRTQSKNELIEAGRDLARLNGAYALRNQRFDEMEEEIQRLERLLNMPPLTEFEYEVARVAKRDINAWWSHMIIRKGSNYGLEPGYAVVYRGGVVGRVKEVYRYTAVVELVSSRTFRMAAHFEGDPRPVTYQGAPNQALEDPTGRVFHVQTDLLATPSAPLRLVSSRLGGVFPDGLTVGEVPRLEVGSDGLFQSGSVILPAKLLEIREVAVLVPVTALGDEVEENPTSE